MTKFILSMAAFFLFAGCSDAQVKSTSEKAQGSVINQVLPAKDFKAKLSVKNVQLVDVRTANEYNGGKIENATNIDFYGSVFKTQIEKLDKSKPVMVYCASGGRSGNAAAMMKSMGFKEVYDLKGGYNGWPFK